MGGAPEEVLAAPLWTFRLMKSGYFPAFFNNFAVFESMTSAGLKVAAVHTEGDGEKLGSSTPH